MAMEFAITAPVMFTGADDSWQPGGSRSFLFGEPRHHLLRPSGRRIGATLRLALIAIFWRCGTLARYSLQGCRANPHGEHLPYGPCSLNLDRLLLSSA